MKNEEIQQRNKDLVEVFWRIVRLIRRECPEASYESIMEVAYQAPAPRYYVSYEMARRFVSQIHRSQELRHGSASLGSARALLRNKDNQYEINFRPNKLTMYYDLYEALRRRSGGRIVSYAPLQEIIMEPAPSFYLSRHSFRWVVEKTISGKISGIRSCRDVSFNS